MKYRYILFDLDGTLTDSRVGIEKSVQYALSKLGIHEKSEENLRKFIGPPLIDSFMNYYGMDKKTGHIAVKYYRECYEAGGIFEAQIWEGIPEVLISLCEEGGILTVASSKPTYYVNRILERFCIRQFFYKVIGASMDGTLASKPDIIREALERNNISDDQRNLCVMVGDRNYDIIGAISSGIDSIGVYYGYAGHEGELEEAGATHIVRTPKELGELLLSK